MVLIRTVNELKKYINNWGSPIGFVPTMGALHSGHLSLIEAAKRTAPLTICSIFVNPTQFNDPADYQQYPISIEEDILLLEQSGCDVLFLPSVAEIYPDDSFKRHFNLGRMEHLLEGAHRPGHFQGVCQVVSRLLHIISPKWLFMGRKDYQQCMVIAQLLQLEQMNTELVIVPTMRNEAGLAMSSRNRRLNEAAQHQALAIYHSLIQIREQLQPGPIQHLEQQAINNLLEAGFSHVDYVSIANASTLEPVTIWDGKSELVALAAAFLHGVRLIDNISLTN